MLFEFGELLYECLYEILTTLMSQQTHFRDPAWLTRQNARQAAILHGVLVDTGIRLLEASQMARTDG
ncbi:MAG TPA: hypothetical protein VG944_09490 [Fimbriimonas sp.]|nr:hypothetical protein [Fimbriimonas sp.]